MSKTFANPFILTMGEFASGGADDFVAGISDPTERRLASAELAYYRGNIAFAKNEFGELLDIQTELDEPDSARGAGITLGYVLASLACGDVETVKNSLEFAQLMKEESRAVEFFEIYLNILIQNFRAINFPPVGITSFDGLESVRPMAFFAYSLYLIETDSRERAVGMAESALIFMKKPCPIATIQLCLNISVGYMLMRVWDKAEYYFRLAWEYAEPDGIIMPFAERRTALSGMLERCLRFERPESYKKISALAKDYNSAVIAVHNAVTGDSIPDCLTQIE
ncbi:MAG: hypothetical protein K6C36_10345, partial [Clostridia bacterium]|nr:hypothetical protein [Clostridia bacterium]